MIKLIKYHVTKRPSGSLGARIQRRDSMSEPGSLFFFAKKYFPPGALKAIFMLEKRFFGKYLSSFHQNTTEPF